MHLFGQGCPECGYSDHLGRYSDLFFERHPEAKKVPATLYVLRMRRGKESFIKVGITTTSVIQRIRNGNTGYRTSVLKQKSLSLYDAFLVEQKVLDIFKNDGYYPQEEFGGRTECLNPICLPGVLELVNRKI
jgi:hypothetical protein